MKRLYTGLSVRTTPLCIYCEGSFISTFPHSNTLSTAWASYQISKIAGCACAGNAGNVSPRRRFQRKPLVSDPGMHHGTCVTHVPWCMSGSLTCGHGENVPGIPGTCAPAILRIWQEVYAYTLLKTSQWLKCSKNWLTINSLHGWWMLRSIQIDIFQYSVMIIEPRFFGTETHCFGVNIDSDDSTSCTNVGQICDVIGYY